MKTKKQRTYLGLPVVDAPEGKGITLTVTKADVNGSTKSDPANCAAARAGQRELKREVHVFLSRAYVKDTDKKRWVRYITPEAASREIISFDRGSSFVPGEYTFKAATKWQKLGMERGESTRPGTGKPQTNPRHVTAEVREWRTSPR